MNMVLIPTHRPPTHPGEMLLAEFLNPMELSQRALAQAIAVPYQRINEIINGQRWDLYLAQQDESEALKEIKPFASAL
jgi:antitoxin HigA-1